MASRIYRSDLKFEIDWELFRSRLKQLMDSRGYNMADLSRATNISIASISRYFYERTPDLTAAWMIADHFEVTLDWLLGRSDQKFIEVSGEAKRLYDTYSSIGGEDRQIIDIILKKYGY